MTDNLIFRELQKILETLTKTKEEHILNFRMIKPTEKFNFCEPILITTKLGLNRLSDFNSVFNVNRRNNLFLNASVVLVGEELVEGRSSNFNCNTNTDFNTNTNNNPDSNITSTLNSIYKATSLLYSTIVPGAHELSEISRTSRINKIRNY